MKSLQQKVRDEHAMKRFALQLLEWHGGQSSGLYSVGSTMLAMSNRGEELRFDSEAMQTSIRRAISELRDLKRDARHPECVTAKDERACNRLADRLEVLSLDSLPSPRLIQWGAVGWANPPLTC